MEGWRGAVRCAGAEKVDWEEEVREGMARLGGEVGEGKIINT